MIVTSLSNAYFLLIPALKSFSAMSWATRLRKVSSSYLITTPSNVVKISCTNKSIVCKRLSIAFFGSKLGVMLAVHIYLKAILVGSKDLTHSSTVAGLLEQPSPIRQE